MQYIKTVEGVGCLSGCHEGQHDVQLLLGQLSSILLVGQAPYVAKHFHRQLAGKQQREHLVGVDEQLGLHAVRPDPILPYRLPHHLVNRRQSSRVGPQPTRQLVQSLVPVVLVHIFARREPDDESHPATKVACGLRELVEQHEPIVQTASLIHTSTLASRRGGRASLFNIGRANPRDSWRERYLSSTW